MFQIHLTPELPNAGRTDADLGMFSLLFSKGMEKIIPQRGYEMIIISLCSMPNENYKKEWIYRINRCVNALVPRAGDFGTHQHADVYRAF
jgi:hypothetical protein